MNEPIRCNRRIIRSSLPGGRVAVGLALAFVAAGACKSAPPTIAGDGRAKVETRAVGPFRIVKASTALRVELIAGAHGVVVRGGENLLPHVETRVVDGTLHVRARAPLKPTLPLWVTVTAPSPRRAAPKSSSRELAPAHHAIHPRPGFSILTVSRSAPRHALCRRAGAHLRGRAA